MTKPKNKSTLLDPHWSEPLEALMPCLEGIQWARLQPSAGIAWNTCNAPGFLIWVVASLATTKHARTRVRKFVEKHMWPGVDCFSQGRHETFAYAASVCIAETNEDLDAETCRAIRRHWKMPTMKSIKAAGKKQERAKK